MDNWILYPKSLENEILNMYFLRSHYKFEKFLNERKKRLKTLLMSSRNSKFVLFSLRWIFVLRSDEAANPKTDERWKKNPTKLPFFFYSIWDATACHTLQYSTQECLFQCLFCVNTMRANSSNEIYAIIARGRVSFHRCVWICERP